MTATSASLQSYMAISKPCVGFGSPLVGLRLNCWQSMRRRASISIRVRCQAEQEEPQEQTPTTVAPPQPTANPTATTKGQPSTRFWDVLAFDGPAPERINGRLAMIGFVSALAVEAAKGEELGAQLMNGGFLLFLGTAVVFSVASLVPLLKGVSPQSRSGGMMNSNAELWNGRFAMLGLVALAFTEYLKGGPLI